MNEEETVVTVASFLRPSRAQPRLARSLLMSAPKPSLHDNLATLASYVSNAQHPIALDALLVCAVLRMNREIITAQDCLEALVGECQVPAHKRKKTVDEFLKKCE